MSVEAQDLRTQLESAFKESAQAESPAPAEKPAATPVEKPAAQAPAAAASGPARDEKGRFAASGEKPAPAAPAPTAAKPFDEKPAAAAAQPVVAEKPTGEPAAAAAAEPAKVPAPPIGWKADDKSRWHELPAWAQAAIAQREVDAHKQISKQDDERSFGREMQRVIQPYLAQIHAEGGTPAGAVQAMLNTAYVLRTGAPEQKRNALLAVARQYGVDLGAPQSPGAQGQNVPPEMRALQQQVSQLQASLSQQSQAQNQAAQQAALRTVEEFAADPANVYFEEVKADVAALLSQGRAPDLKTAYDMACWARSDVRTTLLAQTRAQEEQKRRDEEARRTEEARRKAVSVVGAPGSASVPQGSKPAGSLRDELANQFAASRAAV